MSKELLTQDIAKAKPEVLAKATAIVKTLDHNKQNSVMSLGLESQQKIGAMSSQLLTQVRGKDIGEVGGDITNLLSKINYVDVESLKPSPLASIPFIGTFIAKMFDKGKEIITRYESVQSNINDIALKINKSALVINKDSTTLEGMFVKSVENISELDASILAGKIKIEEVQQVIASFEGSEGIEDYEKNDTVSYLERLEKKVADLQTIRIDAIQTLPMIRTIQGQNQVLEEKLRGAIDGVIPLWKKHLVIALSLNRQGKALEIYEAIGNTTNILIEKNSEMLKENSIRIAQANESTIIKYETLKKVNTNVISMLDEIVKIKEDGKATRISAEVELRKIEDELKNKIISLKSGTTADGVKRKEENTTDTTYETVE